MRRTILFAGPSLPEGAQVAPSIEVRPPARCGDLIRALAERPAAIALVDGVFEVAPSVWHKEILAVLAAGVPVYGAASLGALRAAELDRFGMIGVGAIYAAYRDGSIEDDAAVMVSHAPAELGHRPLTLALVDAEASLNAAALGPAERAGLLAAARRLNFRERSWPAVLAAYRDRAGAAAAARASQEIAAAAFSQKERDVAALLERLAGDLPVPSLRYEVPCTLFLNRLLTAGAG